MFSFGKKEEAAAPMATPLYHTYGTQSVPSAEASAPVAPVAASTFSEPDWSRLGAFSQAPSHAFEAVAEGSGADLSRPIPTASVAPAESAASVAPVVETRIERVIVPTRYVLDRVRSGMTVEAEGDLIIQGEVSSGAEVIAGGNVTILGTCKGRITAGAARADRPANPDAKVFILRCQAELISIGGNYRCFELMPPALADRAVIFSLHGEQLTVHPLS